MMIRTNKKGFKMSKYYENAQNTIRLLEGSYKKYFKIEVLSSFSFGKFSLSLEKNIFVDCFVSRSC